MSELNEEGVAAILGLIIKTVGEVVIPQSSVVEGLPEGSGVRIEFDQETDALRVKIVEVNK